MANDFEKVIDEEIESLHKWQRNPPETAPKDRRILVESDGDFFCANWVKNPYTDDEAWAVAQLKNGDRIMIRKIDCWYELPGN